MTGQRSTAGDGSAEALHYVLPADELEEGERVIIDVNEREVVVARNDGDLYAFANYCPHQGGPLGEGSLSGWLDLSEGGGSVADLSYDESQCVISCPWHGWGFDIESGDHVTQPKYRIPTYDVIVRDGEIYLSLE